jgi:hypothetical protein
MNEPNTARTGTTFIYGSVVIAICAGVGFIAAYQMQGDVNHPKEVTGDPSKRLGTGDGQSNNPATIDTIDKPTP